MRTVEDIPGALIESGCIRVQYQPDKIIVPPLGLRRSTSYAMEPGVVLESDPDSFQPPNACLLHALWQADIHIEAEGAACRLVTADNLSEFRHALRMLGCTDSSISRGTWQTNSGDGIYIGPHVDGAIRMPCRSVSMNGTTCSNCYRQGISITSAVTASVTNAMIRRTLGTAPQAGIDCEPSHWQDRLANIVITDSKFIGNQGSAILVNVDRLNAQSEPIDIRVSNCWVDGNDQHALRVISQAGVRGLILFERVTVENVRYGGVYIKGKTDNQLDVVFKDCVFRNVANKRDVSPITIEPDGAGAMSIVLSECLVEDDGEARPPVVVTAPCNIRGRIRYRGPWQGGAIPNAPKLSIEKVA